MALRIIVLLATIGILYFLFKQIASQVNFNKCEYCNGNGYWKGTRGEKNHCKVCNGSGKGS